MKVRISSAARDFLRAQARELRRHSTSAAGRLIADVEKAKINLSRFPRMGSESSLVPRIRRLVMGDYLLDYEVDKHGVSIVSIRHGAMRPTEIDIDDDE